MKKKFTLKGLGCASCAAKMETAICKLDGVKQATVNYMTTKLIVEGEEDQMPAILREAEKIIKKIEPDVIIKKA
ncbi:MAG: cation transporter [Caldicoprobacterales bacterium]|jgi:cation transport ATPase|nr:heavy metal transporter [Clostridiales bacterium]